MSASSTTKNSESIIEEEPSQEADETLVSTEIYNEENLEVNPEDDKFIEKPQMEVASKIVWTTPKAAIMEPTRTTITKETVMASMEVAPSNGSSTTNWDLEVFEYDGDSRLNSTPHNESGESGVRSVLRFSKTRFHENFISNKIIKIPRISDTKTVSD